MAKARIAEQQNYAKEIDLEEVKLTELRELHLKIKVEAGIDNNPYTWFTIEELEEIWVETEKFVHDRNQDLADELERQVCRNCLEDAV